MTEAERKKEAARLDRERIRKLKLEQRKALDDLRAAQNTEVLKDEVRPTPPIFPFASQISLLLLFSPLHITLLLHLLSNFYATTRYYFRNNVLRIA